MLNSYMLVKGKLHQNDIQQFCSILFLGLRSQRNEAYFRTHTEGETMCTWTGWRRSNTHTHAHTRITSTEFPLQIGKLWTRKLHSNRENSLTYNHFYCFLNHSPQGQLCKDEKKNNNLIKCLSHY